jgi:hypothetical protein
MLHIRRHLKADLLRRALWIILVAVLSGCGDTTPSATSPPSQAARLVLLYEPLGAGCLMAAAEDLTFRIDSEALESVVAVNDRGIARHVLWPRGFIAGTTDNPVVMDPAGLVILRDGDRLLRESPKLHGYDVCFGGGSVTVWPTPLPT